MKELFAFFLAVVCFTSYAQFPNLPYNPDENGDGFIGVVDLQGLLANYGSEFSGAMVSENGESAMVFMGNMAYPLCSQACGDLPGMWRLPRLEDLGLAWDEVNPASQVYNSNVYTWLQRSRNPTNFNPTRYRGVRNTSNVLTSSVDHDQPDEGHRCYCVAKQLPKVEYNYIYGSPGPAMETIQELMEAGWFPLDLSSGDSTNEVLWTFWRWAE